MYLQASQPRHSRAQAAASATRRHEPLVAPLVAGDGGGEPGARCLVSQVDVVVTFDFVAGRPHRPRAAMGYGTSVGWSWACLKSCG